LYQSVADACAYQAAALLMRSTQNSQTPIMQCVQENHMHIAFKRSTAPVRRKIAMLLKSLNSVVKK
jgi:hypothetical protein